MTRILVVDDEKSIRVTVQSFLKAEGHEVRIAEDAMMALALLKEEDFDVVVSDIVLPKMSGVKLLDAIRQVSPHVAVILMTGEPNLETASEALRLGAFDYLSKPISKEAIVRVVGNAARTKALIDEKLRFEAENLNYRKNLEKLVEGRTKSLQESEERYRAVVEDAPVMLCRFLPGGEITFVNEAYCDYFGKTPNELVGSSFLTLMSEIGTGPVLATILALTVDTPTQTHEYRIVAPEADTMWQSWTYRVLFDDRGRPGAYQAIGQDISESKRAEEELQASEARFRSVVATASDCIINCDSQGNMVFVNNITEKVFGYSPDELLGKSLTLIMPERFREVHQQGVERIASGGEAKVIGKTVELVGLRKGGIEFPIELSLSKWESDDGVYFTGMIRDISERKDLEEQIRQAQKMDSVGRLAGGVAHDFNNLLTIITGYADLTIDSLDSRDPTVSNINEIQGAAEKAAALTQQLLAFSRKQKLQPKILDLNKIIDELLKMLQRMIGEDIEIQTKPEEELWHVKIDASQMEQVIINLSINARDAMPAGGRLTIGTQNMVLDEDLIATHGEVPAGNYVMITVADTGEGMSDEVQAEIFDPFFTTKAEGRGTGLGLATVYGIVVQSGGHIDVQTELGQGSTFRIFMPKTEEDVDEIASKHDAMDMPRGTETILVVEDEDGVRSLVCTVLKEQGYRIMEAHNGAEALMICRELEKPVDLVITDVVMPTMGGDVLIKSVREIWPGIKVLYMSGYTAGKLSDTSIPESGDPFLQKPFGLAELLFSVRGALDIKE